MEEVTSRGHTDIHADAAGQSGKDGLCNNGIVLSTDK